MGYTHYWTPTGTFTESQFTQLQNAVKQIIGIAVLAPWSIGIDLEREDPGNIWLNGASLDGRNEADFTHETFCLSPSHATFQFCKTAHKPYDTVVVACLLAAETIANDNGFSMGLGSDGNNDDWRDGCALYEAAFPDRLADYSICVDDFKLESAGIISLEVGRIVPQTVPTASLTNDSAGDPEGRSIDYRIGWDNPEEEDFRFYWDVSNPEEGDRMLRLLSAYDRSLFSRSGAGGVEKREDGCDWESITDSI